MLIAFSVAPLGAGESVTDAVADAVRIVRESGLPNRTDSMFTTIEGEWDECMDVVRRATEAVGRHGHRVSLVLKADIRPGHTGELTGKVERVSEQRMTCGKDFIQLSGEDASALGAAAMPMGAALMLASADAVQRTRSPLKFMDRLNN